MTIHFFILFLFFICGRVYGEVLNADWSCFQYGDELNTVRSEDLIRNLKISSYFDNVKGVFRTGVIGELNSLSVGNQTIPRKLFVNGNSRTVDSLVVDLSFLHLHALANVQSYFGKLDNFRNNHPTLFLSQWEGEESFPTIKKIEKIHGLVVRKSMLEYQVRSMESKMVFIRNKTEQEATLLNKKLSQILRIKEKVHNTIIQSIALHKQNIHKVFEQRINYTKISIEKNFERIIEKEILSMEQLNLDRIEVLKNSTQMIEALADFRIQEESRLFREEESSIFTMLSSKSSIQKEKIESLIRGILDTTGQIFVDLLSSPEMLWMLICLVLAFIIIHTLFVEAFSSLSYLISKSRRLSLSNSRTYESSSGRFHTPRVRSKYLESFRVAFENIYLEDVDLITLQNVFVNLSIAIDTGGLMPNVLLCANSGMGKSTIVKTLISSLSIDATVLSANDLILRKCSGCLKVREIVYQATVKRKPFVFIIEDVETLVGNYHESENNSRNAIKKSLFHIILDCINDQSNKYISFVFTTTTSLDYIERALLDRMDFSIVLQYPTPLLKMKSFLCFFAQTLEGFLLENDQVVFIRDFKDRSFQDVLESISIVRKGLKNSNDPELERELIEPRHSVIVENQSNDNFDFNECFDVFLRFSVHYQWSFREHKKFMENVKTAVLSTERCRLTTRIWMQAISTSKRLHT